MVKVLILGNNGMLGHTTEKVFNSDKNIQVLSTSRSGWHATFQFDVLVDDIYKLIKKVSPEYVINCIGTVKKRINEKSLHSIHEAIYTNALFPQQLSQACQDSGSRVIQIATDCVYNGTKGSYTENELHDAGDIYGKTKSLGEVSAEYFLNLRVSIIGPERGRSSSLLEWFLNQQKGANLSGFANHYWNGVSTLHFARVVLGIVKSNDFTSGKAHLVPKDSISKFDLLQEFKIAYQRRDINIKKVYVNQTIDRTLATEDAGRNYLFWRNAGYIHTPTIREMVTEIKEFSRSTC